jgi:hypothetical protein
MRENKSPLAMSNKIKLLLTKRELELVQQSSSNNIKNHSSYRLKQYTKLARKLRDKYRDLTQRQKVAKRNTESFRTIQKAKVFDQALSAFEKQSKKVNLKTALSETQMKLDHDQHYDIDGVTRRNGKVVIPSSEKISKTENGPTAAR